MIASADSIDDLDRVLDRMGIGVALKESRSVLLKINLAGPPEAGHPRTDPALLQKVIQYFVEHGADCAVAEGADGFLPQNLAQLGLEPFLKRYNVKVIDLDLEDYDRVVVEGEEHYLPKCLRNYALRVGLPALSKRPGMIFSNNVKLFVGAVPRRMYQLEQPTGWRPRLHLDLHRSVANVYRAVMEYAPFRLFVNGGTMMVEGLGEIDRPEILVGDNALELDLHWLEQFGLEAPDYITRLIQNS